MKKFAKGLSFDKLFLIFFIGCIVGTYYEELLSFFKVLVKTGEITWSYRRGLLYGPFSPIYGVGLLLITNFFAERNLSKEKIFAYIAILGGGFEYIISFLQEKFINTTSWDYSNQFLNINGRTTIPIMIGWGLAGLIYICYIYPKLSNIIEKLSCKFSKKVNRILFVLICIDMAITFTALGRQALRWKNIKPYTFIGEIYDKVYTDDYLKKRFNNMEKTKE